MNEDVVILTPAEANAVRQQREEREVEELAAAWLAKVSDAMSHGLDHVTTPTSTTVAARLLNAAADRIALRLRAHGWARLWWAPAQLHGDALMLSSSTYPSSSVVRLHWSEHPEPKAANDPGTAGLGPLVRWGLGSTD